jgi:hypothetical protein
MALRRLMNGVMKSHFSDSEMEKHQVRWCCLKILTMVVADPVFKVYLGCIVSSVVHYFFELVIIILVNESMTELVEGKRIITFKLPVCAYLNTCKNAPLKFIFICLGKKEILCILR